MKEKKNEMNNDFIEKLKLKLIILTYKLFMVKIEIKRKKEIFIF